jgi:hypothetical protein
MASSTMPTTTRHMLAIRKLFEPTNLEIICISLSPVAAVVDCGT